MNTILMRPNRKRPTTRTHIVKPSKKTFCGIKVPSTWNEVEGEDPDCDPCDVAYGRMTGTHTEDEFGFAYRGADL